MHDAVLSCALPAVLAVHAPPGVVRGDQAGRASARGDLPPSTWRARLPYRVYCREVISLPARGGRGYRTACIASHHDRAGPSSRWPLSPYSACTASRISCTVLVVSCMRRGFSSISVCADVESGLRPDPDAIKPVLHIAAGVCWRWPWRCRPSKPSRALPQRTEPPLPPPPTHSPTHHAHPPQNARNSPR